MRRGDGKWPTVEPTGHHLPEPRLCTLCPGAQVLPWPLPSQEVSPQSQPPCPQASPGLFSGCQAPLGAPQTSPHVSCVDLSSATQNQKTTLRLSVSAKPGHLRGAVLQPHAPPGVILESVSGETGGAAVSRHEPRTRGVAGLWRRLITAGIRGSLRLPPSGGWTDGWMGPPTGRQRRGTGKDSDPQQLGAIPGLNARCASNKLPLRWRPGIWVLPHLGSATAPRNTHVRGGGERPSREPAPGPPFSCSTPLAPPASPHPACSTRFPSDTARGRGLRNQQARLKGQRSQEDRGAPSTRHRAISDPRRPRSRN